MQEPVAGVDGGAAGVVAHADGEDGVLGGRHGHAGAGGHLEHDEPEPGGDGVGEPREGRVLAVAPQQLGVLGVAGGLQLGLQPERDEARGVGGVGGGHRGGAAAAAARRCGGLRVGLRRRVGVVVLSHVRLLLLRVCVGCGRFGTAGHHAVGAAPVGVPVRRRSTPEAGSAPPGT